MKMLRFIVTFAVFVCCGFTLPPAKTGPIKLYDNWNFGTSNKKMEKAFKKEKGKNGQKNYYRIAQISFTMGYIAYLKGDTSYKTFFMDAAERFKREYMHICKNPEKKHEAIFKAGLSYYYAKDYENAALFLKKASYISKYLSRQPTQLWFAKSLIKINLNDSANAVLKDYCMVNSLNRDSLFAVVEEDMKNGH